jgi:hypothetical protein
VVEIEKDPRDPHLNPEGKHGVITIASGRKVERMVQARDERRAREEAAARARRIERARLTGPGATLAVADVAPDAVKELGLSAAAAAAAEAQREKYQVRCAVRRGLGSCGE